MVHAFIQKSNSTLAAILKTLSMNKSKILAKQMIFPISNYLAKAFSTCHLPIPSRFSCAVLTLTVSGTAAVLSPVSAFCQDLSPKDDVFPASAPAFAEFTVEPAPSVLSSLAPAKALLLSNSTNNLTNAPTDDLNDLNDLNDANEEDTDEKENTDEKNATPLFSYQAADLLNSDTQYPSELSDAPDHPSEPNAVGRAIAQTEPAEPPTPERFGSVGQTYWYVQAGPSISYDPDDDGFAAFGLAGAGMTDFFAHGHSINLELNKLKFIQPGDDAVGLNLGLILRWHFVREEAWSLYVDGGAGFLVTSEDVPADGGSQFNFTPQVGGGATFRMRNQEHLMVGLRWHHISNAELYPPNPGRDSILLYVGYMWPR